MVDLFLQCANDPITLKCTCTSLVLDSTRKCGGNIHSVHVLIIIKGNMSVRWVNGFIVVIKNFYHYKCLNKYCM